LINLVGELVITQAMIEQRISALDPIQHERLLNSVGQLTRNTRDLQEAVMSIRMMPMDYVFSRFPRMVKTSSQTARKSSSSQGAPPNSTGADRAHRRPPTHLVGTA
jgi:chemotaxis protein histidine kinase CheA